LSESINFKQRKSNPGNIQKSLFRNVGQKYEDPQRYNTSNRTEYQFDEEQGLALTTSNKTHKLIELQDHNTSQIGHTKFDEEHGLVTPHIGDRTINLGDQPNNNSSWKGGREINISESELAGSKSIRDEREGNIENSDDRASDQRPNQQKKSNCNGRKLYSLRKFYHRIIARKVNFIYKCNKDKQKGKELSKETFFTIFIQVLFATKEILLFIPTFILQQHNAEQIDYSCTPNERIEIFDIFCPNLFNPTLSTSGKLDCWDENFYPLNFTRTTDSDSISKLSLPIRPEVGTRGFPLRSSNSTLKVCSAKKIKNAISSTYFDAIIIIYITLTILNMMYLIKKDSKVKSKYK
jgi:hypothetical protein